VRRAGWLVSAALVAGLGAGFAQHEGAAEHGAAQQEAAAKHEEGGNEGGLEIWKWANFALLAAALGWLIRKNAGPFFEARSLDIRKQMAEAHAIHADAERRTSEVEARLAGLQAEIARLKSEALAEQRAESERFRSQAVAEMAKVEAHAQQEIAAAGKLARLELKRYSASLALEAAERKIRARMAPETEAALVDTFISELEPPSTRATTP
jgi:F-type H+-transporting ATPase subunit b